MFTIFLIVGVLILLHFLASRKRKGIQNIPHGPPGFPLVGNLLQIGARPHLKLSKWVETYGKMHTVYIGPKSALVINDLHLIKELFGNIAAIGRFHSDLLGKISWSGSYGVFSAKGEAWQEQRQFCLRALKEFGFQRASNIEPMILQGTEALCDWIRSEISTGKGIFLDQVLKQSAGNAVWTMVTGENVDLFQSKIVHLLTEWMISIQTVVKTGLVFFPWIRYLAPVQSGYKSYTGVCREIRNYVENCFSQHKRSRINGEPPRDIIDAYIDKHESCKNPQSTFYGTEGLKHCYCSVLFLMIAGKDATGGMLNWLIFYLTVYPKIQDKMWQEIDGVAENGRTINLDDKAKMPYTEAVILETFRFATLNILGGFHQLSENLEFHGYSLPKGMILLPNLYYIHNDKSIWQDPESFRPERFLEEGAENLKEYLVSFQPGKRSCLGERFAKDIIFLFSTKLFQKFSFQVDANAVDNEEDYLKPELGLILFPQKLSILAIERTQT